MNPPRFGSRRGCARGAALFWLLGCTWLVRVRGAEDFGDITVSPNAIYTGNTFHGYAEMRVVLENHSPTKTHGVTLVYPNLSVTVSGNSIGRLSRSVTLAPDAREVVSLLQPPLAAPGDGSIRVEVDGHREGMVRAPNANSHCGRYSRGGPTATILVSRSLDFDALARLFQSPATAFMAAKAVGPPDAGGSGGYQPNCWMPDPSLGRTTNWLELDYATPQIVNQIAIYQTQSPVTDGWIKLVGVSGATVAMIDMSAGLTRYGSPDSMAEYNLPQTGDPVKTVRLEFGKGTPPFRIAIDAVSLSGPSGTQWAAAARASSFSTVRYRPAGAAVEAVECIRAESPVPEWSENWLAYSPFDAVVVNQSDVAGMPPAVLGALNDYVLAGGNLLFLGRGELPPSWHPIRTRKLSGGASFDLGFGLAFACENENPAALDPAVVPLIRTAVRDNARYFQSLPGDGAAANAVLPVVESVKIPTRGIVLAMLAFVVVIGPANLIYLHRIKRRTWMLWTIPAISFATTALVFVYSLLHEGVTPDTRISGLTVLDQVSHQAASIAGEGFYCPLTPSGGLRFEPTTEVTPLVAAFSGPGTPREVDWSQAQHFQRGWLTARVPAHFHLRKSETRRERIQVVEQNGTRRVINSLGLRVKSLWVADAECNLYTASNVEAGETGGLLPCPSASARAATLAGPNGLLHDLTFVARADSLGANAGQYLLPNTYLAVLDGNPFVENALGAAASPKRTKSSCVVFGILDPSEKIVGTP